MELQEIWYTDEGSAPMVQTDAIRAVEGGLEGDRYQRGTGHYTPFDVCEVTLVESEALETISAEYGIDLTDGRHRRNLVLSGVDVHEQLLDHRFRIGDAVFEGTRPRRRVHTSRTSRERRASHGRWARAGAASVQMSSTPEESALAMRSRFWSRQRSTPRDW